MSDQVSTAAPEVSAPPRTGAPQPDAGTDGVDGVIRRTVEIAAGPSEIFALLTDPARHPELDGSNTVVGPLGAGGKLYLGRKFTMRMKNILPYVIPNTVVEFETDRRIAWQHIAGHIWRWELTDLGDGRTRVTETWDPRPSPLRSVISRMRSANAAGIEATLRGLQERFGA
jgi:uncharacterized protein YndB with AHSA1/START domain